MSKLEPKIINIETPEDWYPTVENILKYIHSDDDEYEEMLEFSYYSATLSLNGWFLEHVYREGGREGDGAEYWIVFSASKENEKTKYFRVDGWYQSYDGSELDWNDMYEAMPVEKTYIDYVPLEQ